MTEATPTAATTTTARTVTAADSDIGAIPVYPCDGAGTVVLGAECNLPGKTLTCRVVFWDSLKNFIRATNPVTFASDAARGDGAKYLGTPSIDPWFVVGGESIYGIHVDAVSGGSWILTPMAG